MKSVLPGIWILGITIFCNVDCQNEFSAQDLLRLRQLSANRNNNAETVTSYNTNIVHRDPRTNEQSLSSVSVQSVQFRLKDDSSGPDKEDNDRSQHGRSDYKRKIFHIKNPFQQREEKDYDAFDTDAGASNQYASMQYSLPPEGFLNQMRENQLSQQYSTPASLLNYGSTPQPQYQYQTNPSVGYDGNQPSGNPTSHQSSYNNFQAQTGDQNYVFLASPSSYASEGSSTPAPQVQLVSTPAPASQFVGTPNSPTYVSSSAPNYLSSALPIQFLTSPSSQINTGTNEFGTRINNPSSSPSYDNINANSNIQIDHYNNAINGMRYPYNGQQQQYQNEVSSTTMAPSSSSMFPENTQDWRNALNVGVDSLSKSVQELNQLTQFQSNVNGRQESSANSDQNSYGSNGDTHRMGHNLHSPNNMYMNIVQPDYQLYHNMRTRTRDLEQDTGLPEMYSHGDYGWKMGGKRPIMGSDSFGAGTYSHLRPQSLPLQSGSGPDNSYSKYSSSSQTSFQVDSQKPQNVNLGYTIGLNSHRATLNEDFGGKVSSSDIDTQEFVKAAAKVHENMKHQQSQHAHESYYGREPSASSYAPNYPNNYFGNTQQPTNVVSTFYGNTDNKQKDQKYYTETSSQTPYGYGYQQNDLVTAMPYLYGSMRNSNSDVKVKQPFDHAKALKNIQPIDVSDVIYTQDNNGVKTYHYDNSQRMSNGHKDQMEQNIKQLLEHYKPITDSYYKDKNADYGFNIKPKTQNYISPSDGIKPSEFYNFPSKPAESFYNHDNSYDTKSQTPQVSYQQLPSSAYIQNIQPSASASMQTVAFQPQDYNNMLKLNDIPYKISQNSLSLNLGKPNNLDPDQVPSQIPNRINQNVGTHQLEPANALLNKLLNANKQFAGIYRQGEADIGSGGIYSTINGFRIANPYNVDLKLVSDMLKGKQAIDDTRLINLRNQYNNRLLPVNLDMRSLQQILSKGENTPIAIPVQEGSEIRNKDYNNYDLLAPKFRNLDIDQLSLGNSFADSLSSGRYPHQGIKYSRSQEEEETSIVPAAEVSNNHPIGSVVESEETRESSSDTEITDPGVEEPPSTFAEHQPKFSHPFNIRDHRSGIHPRHPNSVYSNRNHFHRKYPNDENISEPYPLLKPPRPPRSRISHFKNEKRSRRRRMPKNKINRILNTQPLFEAESSEEKGEENTPVPVVLRPPPPSAQSKSDKESEVE